MEQTTTDYLYSTDFQHGSSHQREERIYTDDMDSEKITCQASGEQVIYVGNTLYHMTENEISLNISTIATQNTATNIGNLEVWFLWPRSDGE